MQFKGAYCSPVEQNLQLINYVFIPLMTWQPAWHVLTDWDTSEASLVNPLCPCCPLFQKPLFLIPYLMLSIFTLCCYTLTFSALHLWLWGFFMLYEMYEGKCSGANFKAEVSRGSSNVVFIQWKDLKQIPGKSFPLRPCSVTACVLYLSWPRKSFMQ